MPLMIMKAFSITDHAIRGGKKIEMSMCAIWLPSRCGIFDRKSKKWSKKIIKIEIPLIPSRNWSCELRWKRSLKFLLNENAWRKFEETFSWLKDAITAKIVEIDRTKLKQSSKIILKKFKISNLKLTCKPKRQLQCWISARTWHKSDFDRNRQHKPDLHP